MHARGTGLAALLGAALAAAAPGLAGAAERLAAPAAAGCARDQLTVYSGAVLSYRRGPGRTELRIRTDWDTTERVRLAHPGSSDPSRWFLIERAPFGQADWARIEAAPGKLKPGMRAAAWVCSDGGATIVDWMPPR
jgi:hypothetical protein